MDNKDRLSTQLPQDKVNQSVEAIKEEVESLSKTLKEEVKGSGKPFQRFRQMLRQELKESIQTIQQQLVKLSQVEAKRKEEGINRFGE